MSYCRICYCHKSPYCCCYEPAVIISGPQGSQGPRGIAGPQGPQGPTIVITPIVNRFFHIVDLDFSTTKTIPVHQFTNDNGEIAITFSLSPNAYMNLFLNGILQPGNAYSLTTHSLTIYPNGTTIYTGSSIILESVSFSY